VSGIRLGGDLLPVTVDAICEALLRHKVIFFRGQHHLDDDQQTEFGRLLGTPVVQRLEFDGDDQRPDERVTQRRGESPIITRINSQDSKVTRWHTDVVFVADYPSTSILRPVSLPSYGGSTIWVSTAAAYASLPEPLKHLAENLRAVHAKRYDYVVTETMAGEQDDFREAFERQVFRPEKRVLWVHPQTGQRVLVLDDFVRGFVGLDTYEAHIVLEMLSRRIFMPENTIRWSWEPGDVAIWDNRSTQHRAVDDYDDQPRTMHRVTVMGHSRKRASATASRGQQR
jgi:taurine dioxygenase